MRVRITFAKTEAMRYTSHLDLARALERMFRRAGLPLAYTQGFKPHARLQLACALPLGFTSREEVADVWLDAVVELAEISTGLQRAAPPGLQVKGVETAAENAPALQTQVRSADYLATLLEPTGDLQGRIQTLLAAASLPSQRRGKEYDLRPLVEALDIQSTDEGGLQVLRLRLSAREGATGRPEEVLLALEIDPRAARVERVKLVFADESGLDLASHSESSTGVVK